MKQERSLMEEVKHLEGRCGGPCFGGQSPDGMRALDPLPRGTEFPNGARAALLATFDVEGTYGNGTGDMALEIANYERICARFRAQGIPATFNVVGLMAEEHGPQFVEWMHEAGCEVATHGYVHEMNHRHGGDRIYAGHYGPRENLEQVRDGMAALEKIRPGSVRGLRLPYGHWNEYSYDAAEQLGLTWTSHVTIDDWIVPGQGFGGAPFTPEIGGRRYPLVEIPCDLQTYDWSIWMADDKANAPFVRAVRAYCASRGIPCDRTPAGGARITLQRMRETVENETVFSILCHPVNLCVADPRWGDPVGEFLFPIIHELGALHRAGRAWVCTESQLADFYLAQRA